MEGCCCCWKDLFGECGVSNAVLMLVLLSFAFMFDDDVDDGDDDDNGINVFEEGLNMVCDCCCCVFVLLLLLLLLMMVVEVLFFFVGEDIAMEVEVEFERGVVMESDKDLKPKLLSLMEVDVDGAVTTMVDSYPGVKMMGVMGSKGLMGDMYSLPTVSSSLLSKKEI